MNSPSPPETSTPSSALGWRATPHKRLHPCGLPALSDEEISFLLDLSARYLDWSKHHDASEPARARSAVEELMGRMMEEAGLELDADQREYLARAALSHLAGFAPLDALLADPGLEEIAIAGLGQPVRVYSRKAGWRDTDATLTSLDHLGHLINKMARPLGRRITAQSPRLNALLPDGSRLHASLPPLSGGELTIRLHSAKPWSVSDLLASGSTSPSALAFLWLAFQSDSALMVAGNTASGKTTLLDTLLGFIPLSERLVLIEETPELRPAHPHQVRLVCSDELGVSMADLVRDSLRMRPDRVAVGEVRTPAEAQAFVETLLSGQARGSYATFHAQSAPEALRRLRNLGAAEDDLASLDFIVLQRRIARYDARTRVQRELRRMLGIYRVVNPSAEPSAARTPAPASLSLSPVFEHDWGSDALAPASGLPAALSLLGRRLGLGDKGAQAALSARARFLSKLPAGSREKTLKLIQSFAYA